MRFPKLNKINRQTFQHNGVIRSTNGHSREERLQSVHEREWSRRIRRRANAGQRLTNFCDILLMGSENMACLISMIRNRDLLRGLNPLFFPNPALKGNTDYLLIDDEQVSVLKDHLPADFPMGGFAVLHRTSETALELWNKIWSQYPWGQPTDQSITLLR
jgi:hypothetical protein